MFIVSSPVRRWSVFLPRSFCYYSGSESELLCLIGCSPNRPTDTYIFTFTRQPNGTRPRSMWSYATARTSMDGARIVLGIIGGAYWKGSLKTPSKPSKAGTAPRKEGAARNRTTCCEQHGV